MYSIYCPCCIAYLIVCTLLSVTCRSNININDILGDYSLTLIDSLDTLAVMGNQSEFKRAVQLIIDTVSFENCTTVQVFEATIRYTQTNSIILVKPLILVHH